jgi:hypothetical protein
VIEATAAVRESMAEWAARAADSSAVLRATGRAGEAGTIVASSVGSRITMVHAPVAPVVVSIRTPRTGNRQAGGHVQQLLAAA